MKKLSLLALVTAAGIAGSAALPVQAAEINILSKGEWNGTPYVIAGGQVCGVDDLKELLGDLCSQFQNFSGICFPSTNTPDENVPEIDTNAPDVDAPEVDTNTPDADAPEVDPDAPETDNDASDSEAISYAEQVVALVNAERAKAGLNALTLDVEIAAAAQIRAKETEILFSHTRPDGRSFSTVLTDNGITFRGAGENIAWGQKTPEEVMNAWMNSEGHRANILNPSFTKIGVGYYQNAAGRNYWTQLFTY